MPYNTRHRPFLSGLFAAGLLTSGCMMPASFQANSPGLAPGYPVTPGKVLWLDLDLSAGKSRHAAWILRHDGSALPAGADLSLALRDGKLILGTPAGPVAIQDSSASSLELTGESTCVGFTLGEPGSPGARHGWLLVSRDAATGSAIVHDWSCQASPGAPLRPRPAGNVLATAGHPLSRESQFFETQQAYSELHGVYDPYRASFPAITGSGSFSVPGLGTSIGSTLSLGGSQNQSAGTFTGATLVNGANTSAVGTFAGPNSSGITGTLDLGVANTYSHGSILVMELAGDTLSPRNLNLGNLGTGLAAGYTWTVVSTSGGIIGSAADKFTLDLTGFSNWQVQNTGNDLQLVYVPEPSTFAAVSALASLAVALLRRRR